MFSIGQHVQAQWTNGRMYGARIVRVDGSLYEVAWDDGSQAMWVPAHQIQPDGAGAFGGGGQFSVGQHVQAQWTNGQMYGARINQFNGSSYEVVWDDGSPPLWVSPQQIQPDGEGGGFLGGSASAGASSGDGFIGGSASAGAFGSSWNPGDQVMARWTNGQMYAARINQLDGSNYEVIWEDGSPPLWVSASDIQPRR